MPVHRTGNNAYSIQQVGTGPTGAAVNTANLVDAAGDFTNVGPWQLALVAKTLIQGALEEPAAIPAITGDGATTQPAQAVAGQGKEEYRATSATAQVAQSTAGTGALAFRATGASAQVAQSASGTGAETFRVAGATAQPAQSTAAAGSLAFVATGTTAQPAQVADGSGVEMFRATGATAQAPQTAAGSAAVAFIGTGSTTQVAQSAQGAGGVDLIRGNATTTQARQVASGEGTVGEAPMSVESPRDGDSSGGWLVWRPHVIPSPMPAITGRGAVVQPAQSCDASGTVSDPDEEDIVLLLAA